MNLINWNLEQDLCNPVCMNHISEVVLAELIVKLTQNTEQNIF